jgi:hypothetical protein
MVFLMILVIIAYSYFWRKYIVFFSKKDVLWRNAFVVYAQSNLGKYLPGNIGHYAERQLFGAALGIKQLHLAICSGVEVLHTSFAGFMVVFIFGLNNIIEVIHRIFPFVNIVFSLLIVVFVVCILFSIIFFFFRKKKLFSEFIVIIKDRNFCLLFLFAVMVSTILKILSGGILFLIIRGNILIEISNLPLVITAFSASWLIGFITPGVPGGIGIRESLLVLMLSPLIPAEVILPAAIIQRLAMILGEVLAWPLSLVIMRCRRVVP